MNFIFLNKCEIEDPWLRSEYETIYGELQHAQELYWQEPRQCGILLRAAAERICRIYNKRYEVGFGAEAGLKEYLCYSEDEEHNARVSCFLSVVRKEQRDRLNKLRVLGDCCMDGTDSAGRMPESESRMPENAKRMMETMVITLRDMCEKINGSTELKDVMFSEEEIPFKPCPEAEPKPEKKPFLSHLFKNKNKNKK